MNPYRFVFMVEFDCEKDMLDYCDFWRKTSEIIQKYPGAKSTRLHRMEGDIIAVMAIAEWESRESRDYAFAHLELEIENGAYADDHIIHKDDDEFGIVTVLGDGYQIGIVKVQ